MNGTLLSLGHGYTAQALGRILSARGWRIIGTSRTASHLRTFESLGVEPVLWPGEPLEPALSAATHILSSIAPGPAGDPVILAQREAIAAAAPHVRWMGYLSTTAVYGDHDGAWVDETTPMTPTTDRGRQRALAEGQWAALQAETGLPVHIFRLAGIYGPGRGPFAKVRDGTARRIIRAGQVFSRIHVDDIAQVLAASIAQPDPGRVYNVCDDDPAPPEDVIGHAAELLGLPLPPAVPFETADMTPMARSFFLENKRVRNGRIKTELGVRLLYPDYRAGLAALLQAEGGP